MILVQAVFKIQVDFAGDGKTSELIVNPHTDHFCIIKGQTIISRLQNPGPRTWNQIEGNLTTEEINLISKEIDNRYIKNTSATAV